MTTPTQWRGPGGLLVDELGDGPPVVFVHGGGSAGAAAWPAQAPLAARWRLVFPYRLGYAGSPPAEREDFDADAGLLAELLDEGAHLVGHGYGAVAALLAAARRPRVVWTLTLIEVPLVAAARGEPAVEAFERKMAALAEAPPDDDAAVLRAAAALLEPSARAPRRLSPERQRAAQRLRRRRWPHQAAYPRAALEAATFPMLFITGGHLPAFEAIADALALQLGGQRKVIPGHGHYPQHSGEAFNALLDAFWKVHTL